MRNQRGGLAIRFEFTRVKVQILLLKSRSDPRFQSTIPCVKQRSMPNGMGPAFGDTQSESMIRESNVFNVEKP